MNKTTLYDKYVYEWIEIHKKFIKESTYANYMNIINNHLSVDFKDLKLYEFNPAMLQKYVLYKLESGSVTNKPLAIKTVKDIMVVLKLSLRYAFTNKIISSFDLNIKYPKTNMDIKPLVLNEIEIRKIIKTVKNSNDSRDIGILIALFSGLRIGEICALKYKDICLESNLIKVSKTLQRIYTKQTKTKIIETTPKSNSSFRTVPLSDELLSLITYNQENSNNYILSNSYKFVEPRILRNRFNKILLSSDITHYKFHSLRHTFASKCVEAEIDVKTISVILGHANVNTTLNLYVHPNNEQKKNAINKLTAHITAK